MPDNLLSIDRIQNGTRALGPGLRAVVWFHGCSRNCPGCIAAEMNQSQESELYTPSQLADRICSLRDIEGITLSGGEPLEQPAAALTEFLEILRARTSLSIMLFTGYLRAEVEQKPETHGILNLLDILVDGPYVQELDHGELWRGSSNQTIHFLSERFASFAETLPRRKGRPMEFVISQSGSLYFTGIPPHDFRTNLEAELKRKQLGIQW